MRAFDLRTSGPMALAAYVSTLLLPMMSPDHFQIWCCLLKNVFFHERHGGLNACVFFQLHGGDLLLSELYGVDRFLHWVVGAVYPSLMLRLGALKEKRFTKLRIVGLGSRRFTFEHDAAELLLMFVPGSMTKNVDKISSAADAPVPLMTFFR